MTRTSKKYYNCTYENCGKRYRSKYSLRRHYLLHRGIKRHVCSYCGKKFLLAQYLREHIHTHTGEWPYVCNFPGCTKRFRQAGKFSLHRRTHESQNQTKPTQENIHHIEEFKDENQNVPIMGNQIGSSGFPFLIYYQPIIFPIQLPVVKESYIENSPIWHLIQFANFNLDFIWVVYS